MKVAIELPEDIALELRSKWEDIPRHVLESVALEGYRSGVLTESQVRRLLRFETLTELDAFLNQHRGSKTDTTVPAARSHPDIAYLEAVRNEVAKLDRIPTLDEIHKITSKDPSSWADAMEAEREERF